MLQEPPEWIGPEETIQRSDGPFRGLQTAEEVRAFCGDFDLLLEPSVAPADAVVPRESAGGETRAARRVGCGEQFGQKICAPLRADHHEACAAVVIEFGKYLPNVPEITERKVAVATARFEGTGVAARAQRQVLEKCPDVGILAGRDAVGAACGAHREAVFAPAVALVAEVDAENRMPSGELLQVTAQQARGGCAVAEAFGRHEAVGGAAAQKGPQSGDLTGGTRVEDFATLVKGAGYLPEGFGCIALCVFGFGECREFLLACGAAVPDRPSSGRIGFEGGAEDETSLAEREAGQGQEDAARRAACADRVIGVAYGPHFRRIGGLHRMEHRADALAKSAVDAGIGLNRRVAEPLGILLHPDAAGRATLGTGTAAAALFLFVQEDHFV